MYIVETNRLFFLFSIRFLDSVCSYGFLFRMSRSFYLWWAFRFFDGAGRRWLRFLDGDLGGWFCFELKVLGDWGWESRRERLVGGGFGCEFSFLGGSWGAGGGDLVVSRRGLYGIEDCCLGVC
jgi:hypothetical protein